MNWPIILVISVIVIILMGVYMVFYYMNKLGTEMEGMHTGVIVFLVIAVIMGGFAVSSVLHARQQRKKAAVQQAQPPKA